MKKKIILSLTIVLSIFALTGCSFLTGVLTGLRPTSQSRSKGSGLPLVKEDFLDSFEASIDQKGYSMEDYQPKDISGIPYLSHTIIKSSEEAGSIAYSLNANNEITAVIVTGISERTIYFLAKEALISVKSDINSEEVLNSVGIANGETLKTFPTRSEDERMYYISSKGLEDYSLLISVL